MSWSTWHLFTGARAVCGLRVLLVVVSPLPPPPFFSFFCFFFKLKRGRVHTAGTSTGNWYSGAVLLRSPVCVVGALSAATPRGCGSRVLMYMGAGQGGFG